MSKSDEEMHEEQQDAKILREVADTHKAPGDPTKHDPNTNPSDHISKKVYMFPEAYNALRKELEDHYPRLFAYVGGLMAWNAQKFINEMNEALDLVVQFDSGNVDGICKQFLDELRKKRGLLPLHNPSEYFHNTEMEKQVREARDIHENTAPWKQ